jgi:hypothetical protein
VFLDIIHVPFLFKDEGLINHLSMYIVYPLHSLAHRFCLQQLMSYYGMRVFENRMLRRIFGLKRDEVTEG